MSNRVLWLNPRTGNWTLSDEPDDAGEIGEAPNPPVMVLAGDGHSGLVAVGLAATVSLFDLWFSTGARRFLRQRQSPRGNGARVNNVPRLRQQQRFL